MYVHTQYIKVKLRKRIKYPGAATGDDIQMVAEYITSLLKLDSTGAALIPHINILHSDITLLIYTQGGERSGLQSMMTRHVHYY